MPAQYSVSAAADLLSVSVSTVRRIADEFTGYLPDYQPLPGEARRLSTADVLAISAILTRLQSRPGLTRSALLRELSAPGSEPLVIPAGLPVRQPQTAQESPGRAIDVHGTQDSPAQSQTALQTIAADVARLHARIDAIPAQTGQPTAQERPERMIAAVLISLGVIFATVLFAALVWPSAGLVGLVIVAAVLVWGIAPLRTRG